MEELQFTDGLKFMKNQIKIKRFSRILGSLFILINLKSYI
ncbi:hypothetical protein CNEO2_360058 [Clostridium neonatale]|nr:hypothetical protein CNEO2_360058 [Clostridium neonatale]